jgi:hypothetical protein
MEKGQVYRAHPDAKWAHRLAAYGHGYLWVCMDEKRCPGRFSRYISLASGGVFNFLPNEMESEDEER